MRSGRARRRSRCRRCRSNPVGVAFITGSVSAPGIVEAYEHRFPKDHPLRALAVSATTVRAWLRAAGFGRVGKRREMTWREFVRAHRQTLVTVDFFTVETIRLQRLYVLFFIELGSRRVHLAGCTPNPSAAWVIQQARQLSWTLAERSEPLRFLIRDRDQKFTDGFDDVFRSDGIEVVRTPFRAPQANGVAERLVRTVRSECLDRLLILNQQQLERILQQAPATSSAVSRAT
jgi:putative transposase